MLLSQFTRAEAQALHRARRQVVKKHVCLLEQPREDPLRLGMLHVEREALLRAVHPHEVGREPLDRPVIRAGRIAALRALDLDHPRAELRELARRERPGDHLLERNHRDALERPHSNEILNPLRGKPGISVCQLSPGATGCASVSTPVVTISPAVSGGASGCFFNSSTRCPSASKGLPSTLVPTPLSTSCPALNSLASTLGSFSASAAISFTGTGVPTTIRPCSPLSVVQSAI